MSDRDATCAGFKVTGVARRLVAQSSVFPSPVWPCLLAALCTFWLAAPRIAVRADDAAEHWSFRRLVAPILPGVAHPAAARTPVDRFVLAKLDAAGLSLSPPAERRTLLRRLTFDLIGLPPSLDEQAEFPSGEAQDDERPDALARLVDRLLASPQHGPRWARYWLDATGYADSNGYFSADTDRPLAWQYRDYVVNVHNADRPFDEFVREQLAGDELSGFDPSKSIQSHWADALVATHFLRNAPDGTGESDGNPDEVRVDRYTVLEGTLQIVGSSLFGLTLQCSKCHDHKFEPITQREYYQLQAFLYPAYDVEKWVKPNERTVTLGDRKIAWLSDLGSTPPDVALLVRGDPKQRGELVSPDVPAALRDPDHPFRVEPPPARRTTGRRLALARWLTRPGARAEGLLARVSVNRLWQHHFASGLVGTPENLGVTGAAPSHEALLEYLAARFVRDGWSMKQVHREIVLSATYAQASVATAEARRLDSGNRLLSRYPLHRVDADSVRDALLAASGELDRALGGPFVPTKRGGDGEVAVEPQQPGARRRSLYLQQRRTQTESLLAVFDAPSIVANCPRRPTTTTPLQSLAQLNSRFVRQRAEALAALGTIDAANDAAVKPRPSERGGEAARAIGDVWRRAIGRAPSAEELAASLEFLQAQRAEYARTPDGERRAWIDYCQMVLASNAFLYVE